MPELTMGSLFDGIGGFPLAAVRNGITPVWASEIEPFPIEVTKTHFPDMVHVGDITTPKNASSNDPFWEKSEIAPDYSEFGIIRIMPKK